MLSFYDLSLSFLRIAIKLVVSSAYLWMWTMWWLSECWSATIISLCHFLILFLLWCAIWLTLQVIGDITKEGTLLPEYFKGVKKVINAASVIVGPKEGDTPDRAKYSQVRRNLFVLQFFRISEVIVSLFLSSSSLTKYLSNSKLFLKLNLSYALPNISIFFRASSFLNQRWEPMSYVVLWITAFPFWHAYILVERWVVVNWQEQIKGDSPELVEYIGMRNLISAVKGSVGLKEGKLLFGSEGTSLSLLPYDLCDHRCV